MYSKPICLSLLCLLGFQFSALSLPPSSHPPEPEAKFVPDMGFRSWEIRRDRLNDAVGELKGSKPIKAIRSEAKKTIKDTHAFMKDIHELDARDSISATDKDQFQQRAELLASRFKALADSLTTASISSTASTEDRMTWNDTSKNAMTQLAGAQIMLEDTAASLEKMRTEK